MIIFITKIVHIKFRVESNAENYPIWQLLLRLVRVLIRLVLVLLHLVLVLLLHFLIVVLESEPQAIVGRRCDPEGGCLGHQLLLDLRG